MTVTLTTFHVVAIAILVVATNYVSYLAGSVDGIETKLNAHYSVIASLINTMRELIQALKDESRDDK